MKDKKNSRFDFLIRKIKMLKSNRSASMIPTFVVGAIIIIMSFVIVLFLLGKIDYKDTAIKEACHYSALIRASTPKIAQKSIIDSPLKCQTEKICIEGSFLARIPFVNKFIKGCEEFKGEKDVKFKKISSEREVKEIIADSMYDCWWQFYFADNNLYDRSWFEGKTICALCSRIGFDDAIKTNYPEIRGMADFLKKEKIPNSDETYFQYFFRGIGDVDVKELDEVPIYTKQQYVISYDVHEKSALSYFIPSGVGCAASAFAGFKIWALTTFVPVVGWGIGPAAGIGVFIAGCYASSKAGETIDRAIGNDKFAVSINLRPYSVEELKYCDSIVTIA